MTGEPLFSLYLVILVVALAAAGAVLVRRWQSRRALVRRLAELSALAEVGRAISSAQLDLVRLAELVYKQAGQIVDTSIFQLGLFEDDRYRLLVWVVDGEPRPRAEFKLTPETLGIVGWMRQTKQSLLIHDFEKEGQSLPAQPRYVSANPPRSAVFVPLLVGGESLGVIAIQSREPNAFSDEHVRLLSIVATHAAVALENARLYEQARRRATQLELLSEVSQRINVLQPLPSLYRQVVDLVAEKFSEYTVSFYESEGDALTLRAKTRRPGLPPEAEAQPLPAQAVKLGEGLVGEAALKHEPMLRRDLPEFSRDAFERQPIGTRVEYAVPVEIDNRVLGVLDVEGQPGASLDRSVQSVFKALAAQMAIAILEARVYAAEQRRAEHLEAIAQASRTVASSLELDDLLDEVLDLVDERFHYKPARIFLLQEAQLLFRAGTGGGGVAGEAEALAYDLDGPGLIALVGRTRQSIRLDDVSTHPDYVPEAGLDEMRAQMAVPMVMGARLLGVFDVQSDRAGAFTDEDVRTLQTLADTLAVAVRNARLFEVERRRRRLAEILREVSAALTSTLHLDGVLDLILDGLARVVRYDAASILLAEGDEGELILRASRGLPDVDEAIGTPLNLKLFPPGQPVPATVLMADVDPQHEYHNLLGLPEPHASLGVTLAPRGEHRGYLVVDYGGQRRFARGEVELITAFASQAAVAIENARLYTLQREQAWISAALLQVAEATAATSELNEVLTTVVRLTPMLVGVDHCAVLLGTASALRGASEVETHDDETYRLIAYSGAGDAWSVEDVAARLPHGALASEWPRFAEMLATHEPVVMDPDDAMPGALREVFVDVVILLPLLAKGQIVGALVVGQSPGQTPFTAHRVRLLSGIANQAALAIEGAMLYESQQEEAWVSTALLQVAESVAGQPLETGLETVAYLTPILVGIEKIAIYQTDGAEHALRLRQVTGLEHLAAAALAEERLSLSDLGIAADGGYAAAELPLRVSLPQDLAQALGLETGWAWPLRARGEVLGVLVVEPEPAVGRRMTILNGIAHQLAMAMENARLAREVALQERLERELEVGRDIQASFLPQAYPQSSGWEISAFWRAARQVGGDFYDFIPLRPGEHGPRWGIVIADVADKGVPAALFMALSRTLLRSVAISRVSPGDTLARVNQLILADARSEQFVTIFYGVWEPETSRFHYAIGGHNPPVWASAGGHVRTLPGRGIALGVLDDAQYEEHEVHLRPGDTLLLYTDGLTDALNSSGEAFTLRRVLEVMKQAQPCAGQAVVEMVAQAVQSHVGAVEAFDDMTMVVVKHLEEESRR